MAERPITLAEILAQDGTGKEQPEADNLVNALAGDVSGPRTTTDPWLRRWLYEMTGSAMPADYLEEALGPALMAMRSSAGARLGQAALQARKRGLPPPRSLSGVSFSKNDSGRYGKAMDFDYAIYKDGIPIGDTYGMIKGNTANIEWLGGEGATVNSLGVSGVKQMREAFRQDFPSVNRFQGERISGARVGPARRQGSDKNQTVHLNQLAGPAVAGGGLAAYLQGLPEDEPY